MSSSGHIINASRFLLGCKIGRTYLIPSKSRICWKNTSSHFCEHIALDAAVIANCHRRLCKVFLQIVCQALWCFSHSVDIHAVGTCTDYATQTSRAKSKVTIEFTESQIARSQYLTIICSEIFQYLRIGADHLALIHSWPPDVKSWTTFFTNKFEKSQKNKPYKVFSRFRTDLSLVGFNCFLYMILS